MCSGFETPNHYRLHRRAREDELRPPGSCVRMLFSGIEEVYAKLKSKIGTDEEYITGLYVVELFMELREIFLEDSVGLMDHFGADHPLWDLPMFQDKESPEYKEYMEWAARLRSHLADAEQNIVPPTVKEHMPDVAEGINAVSDNISGYRQEVNSRADRMERNLGAKLDTLQGMVSSGNTSNVDVLDRLHIFHEGVAATVQQAQQAQDQPGLHSAEPQVRRIQPTTHATASPACQMPVRSIAVPSTSTTASNPFSHLPIKAQAEIYGMSHKVNTVRDLYNEFYSGIETTVEVNGWTQQWHKPPIKSMIDSPDTYPAWKEYRKSEKGRQFYSLRKPIIDLVDQRTAAERNMTALQVADALDVLRDGQGLKDFSKLKVKPGKVPPLPHIRN